MRKTWQIGEKASKIPIAICFSLCYNGDMKKINFGGFKNEGKKRLKMNSKKD